VAVAETKSLRNAIERLHIAQPALSQSIKLLEEELGTSLFIRSRKGMELTSTGAIFLQSAKSIMREVSRAKERVLEEKENPAGSVSIAMPPSVSSVLAVPLFREVKKRYPNIVLNMEEHTTLEVRQCFDTGTFDLLVYFQVDGIDNLVIEPLIMEELYFACKYSEEAKLPSEIEFSALVDYPLMFPQVPFVVNRTVAGVANQEGVKINILPNKVAMPTLINLVRQGLANSILPWTLINQFSERNEIAAAKVVNPSVNRTINLISPANRHCSNATLAVMELIRGITKRSHENGTWRGTLLLEH